MRAEEICTHYSEDPSRFAGAVTPPIFQSSLFTECEGNEGDREGRYAYTRVSNPTTEIVENKVAALEQGEAAKCFSSGMGAISAAMMHYLKKDSHVVAVASIYGPANTHCTPIFQKPLTLGIDMVVHSASKYLGGHSDIIGGVVIGRKEDIDQIAQSERELFGAVMSPFDSWLMLRGIRTLPVRMKQHMANAMEMAAYFQELPVVKEVIYPWWETHPQYELAKKQMTGASGLMSVVFDLPGEQIKRIVRELEFFHRGPSWGGFESLISPVGADLEQDNETMKKGLVRLHIGLEGADLLKEDFERAVKNVLG